MKRMGFINDGIGRLLDLRGSVLAARGPASTQSNLIKGDQLEEGEESSSARSFGNFFLCVGISCGALLWKKVSMRAEE